ncbi:ATP-binding protein [Rubinisphaera margarita]|uniref:ATP-binding protein n=1 Tax=Rubinisphaera margarita TaxID=2909586 RepID=UPI001EE92EDE|nr:ATP-binding protein [Rubinisphaera margarita]MCG6158062.1 ATP-binding protein [Rubinisphaera margarita]
MSLKTLSSRLAPWIGGGVALLICLAGVLLIESFENERYHHEVRADIVEELGLIRSRAESAVNARMSLTIALRAFVSSDPSVAIDPERFGRLGATMISATPGIRNIALSRGTTICNVWPYEPNKEALGVNLLEIPHQREAIEHVMSTKDPVLAGPLKLIQGGGKAFINRASIFVPDPDDPASEKYWGMAAIVIDGQTLLDEVLQGAPKSLEIAIRGKDGRGDAGEYFYGSEDIEQREPIRQGISLLGGSWQILAAPMHGWQAHSPYVYSIRILGGIGSILVALTLGCLITANIRSRNAKLVAEDASRAKTQFLGRMSHEIRTPLTAISGFTEELRNVMKSEDALEHIEVIERNSDHLMLIVNDILDVAQIESRKMKINHTRFDLLSLINDVVNLYKPQAERNGVDFKAIIADDVPRQIHSDPVRIRQVLMNLVGNAIKFTKDGLVEIEVESRTLDLAMREIQFIVRDTGIGISSKVLPHIFEPFVQEDASTNRRFGGTGLGLVICRSLCRCLGGEVSVKSEVGKGSEFLATLKVEVRPERPLAVDDNRPNRSSLAHALDGRKILLAEDGIDNQRLVQFIIEKAGAEIVIVENGQQALDVMNSNEASSIDVILMDMQMPIVDGYTATRRLREQQHTLPIIALTAHVFPGEIERCLKAGCDVYMSKPIDRRALIEKIREMIGNAAQGRPSGPMRDQPSWHRVRNNNIRMDRHG